MAAPDTIAEPEAELPEGSRYDFRHDLSPNAPEVENYSEGDGSYGYAHSYETGSSVDGPGIRITLFLSGCPLKCQYCHNPDTWRLKHGVRISLERIVTRLGHFAPALRAMKGGLTISGGEVLLQTAFSRRILGAAKKMRPSHRASKRPASSARARPTSIWRTSTWSSWTSNPVTRKPIAA